jgi:hypothetical protein
MPPIVSLKFSIFPTSFGRSFEREGNRRARRHVDQQFHRLMFTAGRLPAAVLMNRYGEERAAAPRLIHQKN